jgi:hypothetical protein
MFQTAFLFINISYLCLMLKFYNCVASAGLLLFTIAYHFLYLNLIWLAWNSHSSIFSNYFYSFNTFSGSKPIQSVGSAISHRDPGS